jgi:hypothetical protein
MADAPIYQWRPTGTQQPGSNYFGQQPQSFGQALNNGVQAAGGAKSPVQPGGFNIPGGSSTGFSDPNFNAAAPATTPAAPGALAPASFGDALRTNPLSKPFPTSPDPYAQAAGGAAMQDLQPNQGPSMSSMFALNEYNKSEGEALRKAQESSALNGRAFTGQIAGDTANELTQKLIPARQNFLGQLQGQEQQQELAKRQAAEGTLTSLSGQTNQANIADKQIASGEKIAAGNNATAVQISDLGNATQKYIADNNLGLDYKKLDAQIQQFGSNQDFQKWAVTAGIDAQTAHDMWAGNQADIQRKWQSGENLTANEQAVRMEGLKETHDTAMASLNHTLNLDTIEKQNANDITLKKMDQTFTSMMTDKGYSHDEAMAATKQEYAKELEGMGFDHDTAMQASDQWFKGQQADADRTQAKYLAEAQMAQTYDMFSQDLQQKYGFHQDDVTLAKDKLAAESDQFAKSFGLDQAKFDLIKGTQEFQNLSDTTATLMSMAGDNPDMLQFAAENFYKGMGNLKNPDGTPVMSPDQVRSGTLAIKAGTFTDTKAFTDWATANGYKPDEIAKAQQNITPAGSEKVNVQQFSDFVSKNSNITDPAVAAKLTSDVTTVKNLASGFTTDKRSNADGIPGAWMDAASDQLRKAGVPEATIQKVYDRNVVGNINSHASYEATQAGADYAIYAHLIQSGIGVAAAPAALEKLLGPDRAKAALALEGAK